MQEIINGLSYKLMVLIIKKREAFYHISGVSKNMFEFVSSITFKSTLLASMTNITFIIEMVLLWPLNHICFTE